MYSIIRVKEDLLDFSDRGRLFQSFTVLTAKVCPPSEMFLYTYLQEMAWTSIRVQISYALFLLYAAFTPLFWIPTPSFALFRSCSSSLSPCRILYLVLFLFLVCWELIWWIH